MIEIDFGEKSLIHPSYVHYILQDEATSWNKEMQNKSVRAYQLCLLFPKMEAEMIVKLVEGKLKTEVKNNTLLIQEEE